MYQDLIYQLALRQVPHIGDVHAKILVQQFGNAEAIFRASHSSLEKIEGIGSVRARNIKAFKDFSKGENEIRFMEKYSIRPLFLNDKDYPQRLLNCYDSPTLLFYKGTANLNAPRIIAIIGTRSNTDYGRKATGQLINEISVYDVLIVSGLAFGIDAIAHRSALKNNLPTVAVIAHGMDHLYPPEHGGLAREMLQNKGGLLTEHRSDIKPDKHHFPVRNRIVAGMSDAVVVVETEIKGGSMITADLANGYNKDVFAIPGRTNDIKSSGCNHLVRTNKAILLTGGEQLIETMGWASRIAVTPLSKQKELFIELSPAEKSIFDLLNEKELTHIDELNIRSGLSGSQLAAAILNLELNMIITSLPGKLYKIS